MSHTLYKRENVTHNTYFSNLIFFRVTPSTLRVYIHSLAGFLQFLAGSRPWLRHLDLVSGQLKTLEERIKNIGKSLRTDVLKDKVERHARGDDKLDLEPGQVAAYLESGRIQGARALLEESAAGRELSRAERTDVRNSLALQILLTNAKRAGDVTHLRRADVMSAQSVEGADVEIEVSIIDLILFLVFNATFHNISAISWRPVLEEAGVPGENHRPWASNW